MDSRSNSPHLPHFPTIIKLDRSNYAFWRAQAISTIHAHNFDRFISTSAAAPPPFLPSTSAGGARSNPDYDVWHRKDQFLLSWLLSSLGESMLGHVVRCTTAAALWNVLERLFMSQSKARVMQLRLQLQSTKKGSQSVDEYFLKMRGFADQLSAVGQIINDDELIMYILAGIGPEFEALVVSIMHHSENQNLQEVQYAFQAYELRLQQQQSMVLNPFEPTAHVAYKGGRGFSSNRGGSTNRGGRSSSGKTITCQLCGRNGHVAIKCFKRFDINFTETSATSPQAFYSDSNGSSDALFSQEHSNGDNSWYVDSGATAHITNDMNNLAISNDYTGPESLVVGNGQSHQPDSPEGQPL